MSEETYLYIVDATYTLNDQKEPIIHLFCRGEDGKSYQIDVEGFSPYFFVPIESPIPDDEDIISWENTNYVTLSGKKVKKIVVRNPKVVKKIRDEFPEHYEADIVFVKRFLIDKNIFGWIKKPEGTETKNVLTDVKITVNHEKIEPVNYERIPKYLKVASIDIECWTPEHRFPDYRKDPIISIAIVYRENDELQKHIFVWSKRPDKYLSHKSNGEINLHIFDDEKKMLIGFRKFIWDKDFDVILGWNSIKFDFPYILYRMKNLGIEPLLGRIKGKIKISESGVEIPGRIWLDGIELLKYNFFSFESWKLDTVASEILGKGKVEMGGSPQNIIRYWEEARFEFIKYNVTDAELVLEIVEKTGTLNSFVMQAVVGGVFIYDVKKKTAIFDSLILREARNRGLVLPSKKPTEKGYKYSGARVIEPKKGLHKYVAYLDFASLYPNIMITFNISFDTLDPNGEIHVPNYHARFKHPSKGLGIVPYWEKYLLERRAEAKKLKKEYKKLAQQEQDPNKKKEYEELSKYYDTLQLAFKIIANSFYGAMGYERNRVFNIDVAESITTFARFWNEFTEKKAYELGYETIYGDTDSIFIKTGANNIDDAFKVGFEIMDKLNQIYKEYISKHWNIPEDHIRIEIKLEGIFEKILFSGVKKRYVGLFKEEPEDEPKLKVVGFETKRTDWAPIAQELQKLAAEYALQERIDEFKDVLKKYLDDMFAGKLKEKLIIYKQITKDPKEYKSIPPHVRAFIKAKKMGKRVFVGDKIGMIKTTKDWEAVVDEEDLKRINNIDYQYYIEKQIKPAVERILSAFDLKFEDIYEGKKQTPLDAFF